MKDQYQTIKDGQLLIFNQSVAKAYLIKVNQHLKPTKK